MRPSRSAGGSVGVAATVPQRPISQGPIHLQRAERQLYVSAGTDAQVHSYPPQHTNGVPLRLYRASEAVCQVCPAFGVCTRAKEIGRSLAIGPHDAVLRRHRAWMSTSAAREAYKLRKQLVEPVFGIIKEQQGARRFLLRGLVNVAAEWTMLATAFNLRTLWRVWRSSPFIGLFNGPEPCPVS